MIGLIDVGGGLRGMYSAGVYDYLLEQRIKLPYCLGVSAGSANLISYLAGQKGRNATFYLEYTFRKAYMSLGNWFRKGSYLDLDYIYSVLCNRGGEYPIDYDAFRKNPARYVVTATDAVTGKARYFTNEDVRQDNYDVLKASCAMPFACKPYVIDGVPYFDGGVADPVPYLKALADGCDRLIVILTRPAAEPMPPQAHYRLIRGRLRNYPNTDAALSIRHIKYNQAIRFLQKAEAEGKALLLSPKSSFGMKTLTKDKQALKRLYAAGYMDAVKIKGFIKQ